jgi:alkylation response protein AidB-like acyl-CoA dehydrogenase
MTLVLPLDQDAGVEILARLRATVAGKLRPRVRDIDEGAYPADVLRDLGAAGAYAPLHSSAPDLATAIEAMAIVGEECLATAFCVWCQDALGWYIACSGNDALSDKFQQRVAQGEILGGTGLSNPMKALSGIEPLRLRGERAEGGWRVSGLLPWVSNLGEGHLFGICFSDESDPNHLVVALARCGDDGVTTRQNAHFIALEGTATVSVAFRDAFIADSMVLADPAMPFIRRMRAGFVLLQTGMALGLVRGAIALMRECGRMQQGVNAHLPDRPDDFEDAAAQLTGTIHALAETPYEGADDYLRAVLQVRLQGSELTLAAAQSLMLHAGARGYLAGSAASRKLREAYFVAIVTPAIKHLRKDIEDLSVVRHQ